MVFDFLKNIGLSYQIRERLRAGAVTRPDSSKPEHGQILDAVAQMADTLKMPLPKVFIVPIAKAESASPDYRLGEFGSWPLDNALQVPESAVNLFTPREMQAMLAHEFTHLAQPEMAKQKAQATMNVIGELDDLGAILSRSGPKLVEQIDRGESPTVKALAEISDKIEMSADKGAMDLGLGEDMASALTKCRILHMGGSPADFGSADAIRAVYKISERDSRRPTLETCDHTSLTHAQRVDFLRGGNPIQGRGR